MPAKDFLGVWRLRSLTMGGQKVFTSQTHLVVRKDVLWEVSPDETYYEGESGPESRYRFQWKGREGRLQVLQAPRRPFCAIVRVARNELRVRWGGVLGQFPESFDEDYGQLGVFEREKDAKKVAELSTPPSRTKRKKRRHRVLGELAYDDDLSWWIGKVKWGTKKDVIVHVSAPLECKDAVFDRVAERLKSVRERDVKAYAATKLLDLKNENWLTDGEKPVTAAKFRAKLSPESFSVDEKGRVSVCFEDGDLFWGHVVLVELDTKLRPVDAEIAG